MNCFSLSEMEIECGLKLNGMHQLLRRTLTPTLLPPFHIQCPEHYSLTEYHFQPPLSPNELLGWNSRLSLRPCNVLHISKPIYLHGHIHIFIQSLCHQALHHSILNQDSTFKQTNELWMTPSYKLPALSISEKGNLKGIKKGKGGRIKTILERAGAERELERKQRVWGESIREENTEEGGWETARKMGEHGSREASRQEKTSAPWEHSDGLSKAPLCSHCWSASQN